MAGVKETAASRAALKKAQELGLRKTSDYRSPAKDKAVGGSGHGDHTKGQAYDFAGSFANMKALATWAHKAGVYKQVIFENKDYKTGRYIGGHMDHVHIAWFADSTAAPGNGSDTTVEKGDKGGIVEAIQKLLGIVSDGLFGEKTETAVEEFQKKNGLVVDGIVGKNTWNELTSGGGIFFS